MTEAVNCDVLVAGGGTAGLAAAVSAARQGAKVVLMERYGFLGGMGTAALVHTLCGLYVVREDERLEEANPGLPMEVARRLIAMGGASGPVRMGKVQVLPHDPWSLAVLADEMTIACGNGLEVRLHSEVVKVEGDDVGWEVQVISRGQTRRLKARALVDATGDAVLTSMAGAGVRQVEGDRLQRPAYVVKLGGVEAVALSEDGRLRLAHGIAFAVRSGALPAEAMGAGVRRGLHAGECFLTLDLAAGGAGYDPLAVRMLSEMEQVGRGTVQKVLQWMKSSQAGFRDSWVAAWPVRAGVRESCRLEGQHELTVAEVLEGREFEDGIARIGWPVELREKATGPRWQFAAEGAVGSVPLRALRSVRFGSLFAAGRCLSATHEALGAVRVMGTCLASGAAAGIAAGLVAEGVEASAAKVRTRLIER